MTKRACSPPRWWPIVFWYSESKDDWLIYKPSWSHHGNTINRSFKTYVEAIGEAIRRAGDFHARPGYAPVFLPDAVHQLEPPNYDPHTGRLRLRLPAKYFK